MDSLKKLTANFAYIEDLILNEKISLNMDKYSEQETMKGPLTRWLNKNYKIQDYKSHYKNQLHFQRKLYLGFYFSQIVLFPLSLILPWYRFVKTQGSFGETFIIDAGALELNDLTPQFMLLGMIIAFLAILYFLRNLEIKRTKIRLINGIIFFLFILTVFGFMAPEFAAGLGNRFSESIGLYNLSTIGYSIYPLFGYIVYLVLGVSVIVSFVFSLLWDV